MPVFACRRYFSGLGRGVQNIAALGIIVAIWIVWFYFTSLLSIPADFSMWLPVICAIIFIFRQRGKSIFSIEKVDGFLIFVLIVYTLAFFFSGMLPGCDTSMHGYITRLIIEQNGLPLTYRPLIPENDFGAYASGFHLLAAMFSIFNSGFLLEGLSMSTMVAYFVGVSGLCFLLTNFTKPAYAWPCTIVAFWFHASLQSSITWGGSPTVLSLGLIFFMLGFIEYALKHRSLLYISCAACLWAASVLTHPIPAYIGVYVACLMALYGFWLHRPTADFVWRSIGLFIWIAGMMLIPFMGALSDQSSAELSEMIAKWQHKMMGGVVSGNLLHDWLPILSRIKIGIGDLVLITSVLCMLWLMFRRRHMQWMQVAAVSLLLYAIVLNAGFWLLPFSELLYPERAMYFFVVPFGMLLSFAANGLDDVREKVRYRYWWVMGFVAMGIALYNFQDRYWQRVVFSERHCDAPLMEAFAWIESNTDKDAVFHTNYDTEGMWIPALGYRATVGTHLHFIHERDRVFEKLGRLQVDHYEFRLVGVQATSAGIDSLAKCHELVFKNSRVEVVRTRKRTGSSGY
ncbi:MAG: hypothetical protein ACKOX7_06405 [Bacteroidota bacterium]